MQIADGRLVVTFNGEIYNYRALRSRLEAKGNAFQSNSDTEVWQRELQQAANFEAAHASGI
jgi:asparagine synthase (glutamine-hydrolysing)